MWLSLFLIQLSSMTWKNIDGWKKGCSIYSFCGVFTSLLFRYIVKDFWLYLLSTVYRDLTVGCDNQINLIKNFSFYQIILFSISQNSNKVSSTNFQFNPNSNIFLFVFSLQFKIKVRKWRENKIKQINKVTFIRKCD